jgi:uncharacterized glyoxalase superfamily protein PhnB
LDFYGRLGFTKVKHNKEAIDPEYLVMQKDGVILNFWSGNDKIWEHSYFKKFPRDSKRGFGLEIIITVDDVETCYQDAKQFATVVSDLKLRPWGLKDFRIEDPFGYYLRITERYDILDPDYGLPR